MSEIRTVLFYKEEPEKKSVRNPRIAEKNYKECWKCGPAGHPIRQQIFANSNEMN